MSPNKKDFETMLRGVVDACADCDTCRFLMDESCLLFPELYRLYDNETERGCVVGKAELERLSELCTLCGLCPCPDIRMDVIRGKTDRAQTQGVPLPVRFLADVQSFGQLGAIAPKIFNRLLSFPPTTRLAKKIAGIHPKRSLPRLPEENFFAWARRKGLSRKPDQGPKIAYFAGCAAGYLFPEVARATVSVLERAGVSVFVPPQRCCGMPTLLEGEGRKTIDRVRFNMKTLLEAAQRGFDIVCSCPTCGFMMKVLLKEGAFHSEAYQSKVGSGSEKGGNANREDKAFIGLNASEHYRKTMKDNGYFSSFDPLERITLSENVFDAGEYLGRLQRNKKKNPCFGELRGRMAYFAPCHQREQGIGSPYPELLASVSGLAIEPVGGVMDCCGMGGSLGYKKGFYDGSTRLASPLIRKIRKTEPEAIITDCLSCRLQFQHLLPYPVYHPMEVLDRSFPRDKIRDK